jgi:hypothetical protein
MVLFVSDRMSYITLRGRWCNFIVLNIQDPTEDKLVIGRTASMSNCNVCLTNSVRRFHTKVGREDIFKPTIGTKVYTKSVLIMELG